MSLLSFAKKISGRTAPAKGAKKPAKAASPAAKETAPVAALAATWAGQLNLQPLITEDSIVIKGNVQTVVFRVRPTAHKRAIAAAVQERFGVEPTSIRTIQVWGKTRRRGRTAGTTPAWKKAYVTLPAGATIDITA